MAASEKVCTCTKNFWRYSKGRAGSDELTFCHPENTNGRDGGITPMCMDMYVHINMEMEMEMDMDMYM